MKMIAKVTSVSEHAALNVVCVLVCITKDKWRVDVFVCVRVSDAPLAGPQLQLM